MSFTDKVKNEADLSHRESYLEQTTFGPDPTSALEVQLFCKDHFRSKARVPLRIPVPRYFVLRQAIFLSRFRRPRFLSKGACG